MVYLFTRFLAGLIMRIRFRLVFYGRVNRPTTGPGIVISNHDGWEDIPLVGCFIKPRIRFVGKKELWQVNWLASWYFTKVRVILVDRDNPKPSTIKECLSALRKGEIIGLFPEGTRAEGDALLPFEPLLAKLALDKGVPVYPIGIRRIRPTQRFRRTTIEIRYGYAINFKDQFDYQMTTRFLEQAVAVLSGKSMPPRQH